MVEFDKLDYYAIPSLPNNWIPPSWLPFELGILAGRLYFDFAGYETVLEGLYLTKESLSSVDESTAHALQALTKRHLTFLQERPLRREHPFFQTRRAMQVMPEAGDRPTSPTANSVDCDEDELNDSGNDERLDMFDDSYGDTEGSDLVS
ncbi:hypothetical protein N8T08_000461 [Aspergillus melleus]|uniref:Uncharacterized protein n=1 Tax=Aspergillus melleus TaxID=138277 RepID=A0ACC3BBS8_9EURO|nr:hypothetical protein N8T08_000461 [Aspergillus melleus]